MTEPTFAEINAQRKSKTQTIWLPLDSDLLEEIDELDRQIRVAERLDEREHRTPEAPRLKAEVEELRNRLEASAVAFKVRELPRKQYRDLIDKHPSDEPALRWNEVTFAPALIAAAIVSPAMTGDDAQTFWDDWGAGPAYAVFGAAVAVNEEPPKVPFSARSTAGTTGSNSSSTTADPEA